MDINVNIKCPDLTLAAETLAKALIGLTAPAHSAAVDLTDMAKKLDETPAQILTPQPTVAPAVPAQAPVFTAPTPVTPPAAAASVSTPAPTHTPVFTAAPDATVYPSSPAAPAAVPTSPAPQITGDMVAKAGADLIAANPAAMAQLNGLLQKYGVGCAQELRPDQIGPFATEMRALGAKI